MEGDSAFMNSLQNTTEEHRFALGSGTVFIRGGERKTQQKRTTTGGALQAQSADRYSFSQPNTYTNTSRGRGQVRHRDLSAHSNSSTESHHTRRPRIARRRGNFRWDKATEEEKEKEKEKDKESDQNKEKKQSERANRLGGSPGNNLERSGQTSMAEFLPPLPSPGRGRGRGRGYI